MRQYHAGFFSIQALSVTQKTGAFPGSSWIVGYFKAALTTWINPGTGVSSHALVESVAPGLCFAVGRWLRAVGPYRAYSVDQLSASSATTLEGSRYLHQDWGNHYVDVMRFAPVDRKVMVDSAEHEPTNIKSGSYETAVYFCWAWAVPVV